MLGIAIIGGECPPPSALKEIAKGADLLVAADSGLIACEGAGLLADWIIGDMDSLDDQARLEKYPPGKVLFFPRDKDFSDTELAVSLLFEKGCDEIWLAGGGGGRVDHFFAIASLFEREKCPDRWFPGKEEIFCLKKGKTLKADLSPGSIVSVFPLGKEGWEAESSGLKWPLKGLSWERGHFGLSNEAAGPFEIRSIQGRFMVILSGDGK